MSQPRKRNILFVCTGNTCRSPMAQALFTKELAKRGKTENFTVISAGISATDGDPATKEAVLAMEELSIDITDHKAQKINDSLLTAADLIITMTGQHKAAILTLYPQYHGKVYTLREYAGNEAKEEALSKLKEIDKKEAELRQQLDKEMKSWENNLLAKRNQLWEELKEVEQKLQLIKLKKEDSLFEFQKERELVVSEGELDLDIKDPFGFPLETYKETSQELQRYLPRALDKICKEKEQDNNHD